MKFYCRYMLRVTLAFYISILSKYLGRLTGVFICRASAFDLLRRDAVPGPLHLLLVTQRSSTWLSTRTATEQLLKGPVIPPAVVRVTTGNFKVQPLVTIQVGVYDGERNRPSYPVDCTDWSANPSIIRRGSILKRLNEPTHLTPGGNVFILHIYK